MKKQDIITIRLQNQLLAKHAVDSPKGIVSWMGAMQAQDYNMAKWGIGARLSDITDKEVEDAVNRGDIIRTHVMRPTWHFVASDDIHWLLQLTAPRIKTTLVTYNKYLNLSDKALRKSTDIVIKSLENNNHLTRLQLCEIINNAGVAVTNDQVGHVLFHAELDRIVCNGSVINKKQTYGLLEEKVPAPTVFDKDEALEKLATKYFQSHGPATLQDFVWWSGLVAADARRALEIVKNKFIFKEIDSQTYIYPDNDYISLPKNTAYLLPAFDEFLVAYKDRKESLAEEHLRKIILRQGTFKPFVLYNLQVIGSWRKIPTKNTINVEFEYFTAPGKTAQNTIDKAISTYKNFLSIG